MSDDSLTPRTLIQGILENNPDKVEATVRVTRRQANQLNMPQSSTRHSRRIRSASESSSNKKSRANQSRLSATMSESTPRSLIAGFLNNQDSEKTVRMEQRVTRTPASPKTAQRRRSRRQSLLREATTRSLQRSVVDVSEETTPRTLIRGIIDGGDEETPVVPFRQSQRSVIHEPRDPSFTEMSFNRSSVKGSQQSVSALEDSFMDAYSQPQANTRLSRKRRSNMQQSSLSTEDFAASVREKLSQSNKSRWTITQSQLENISEISELQDHTRQSTVLGVISVQNLTKSRRENRNEEELIREEAEERHQIKMEVESGHTEEEESQENMKETGEEESEAQAGEGEVEDLDLSEDYTSTNSTMPQGMELQQQSPDRQDYTAADPEENQDVTIGVGRRVASSHHAAIVSATNVPKTVSEDERGPEDEAGGVGEEDAEERPDRRSGDESEERVDNVQQEVVNRSLVPASESDDQTDGPEGLPGFNTTFTSGLNASERQSPANSMRQTTLDNFSGYSAIQTPMLPPFGSRSGTQTPDLPQTAVQNTRLTTAQDVPPENNAKKKRQPVVAAVTKVQRPQTKKEGLPPRVPRTNTSSIFKHFTTHRVSADALDEIEKVADEFWKNVVDDLGSYANHRNRSTVDESDINLLMTRQRLVTDQQSMYALVEKYLPLEHQMEIIDVVTSGNKITP